VAKRGGRTVLEKNRCVVVGAGAAGLAATYHLLRGGVEVVTLESSGEAGGRLLGGRHDGRVIDLGAQFFFRPYRTTFELCGRLGLEGQVVPFPFRVGLWRDGVLTALTAGLDPRTLAGNFRELLRFRLLSPAGVARLTALLFLLLRRRRDLHFLRFPGNLDLDGRDLASFTLDGYGEEVLEYYLQPLVSCLTLGQPEEIGAGYGLALAWYAMQGCCTLKEGIWTLADRLHRECRGSVRLSTPAREIVIEAGKVRGVETEEGFLEAGEVVCCTSASAALRLMPRLPDGARSLLAKIGYSSCCHVVFGFPRRSFPAGWYAVALPRRSGSSMAGFSDDSTKCPSYAPPGESLVHCFTFGAHARELNAQPDRLVAARLLEELRSWAPSPPPDPLFRVVHRWEEAVCLPPPGTLRQLRRLARELPQTVRGLHLAGEYLYMPSVEGALRSGMDAADEVLRS